MSEVKTQEIDSTQQQQQQQQQSYQDSNIYSAETEQLYLKMKDCLLYTSDAADE